ncbi:hypothetical protein ACOSQ2_016011 [Xanthoceras sorbifolium]
METQTLVSKCRNLRVTKNTKKRKQSAKKKKKKASTTSLLISLLTHQPNRSSSLFSRFKMSLF